MGGSPTWCRSSHWAGLCDPQDPELLAETLDPALHEAEAYKLSAAAKRLVEFHRSENFVLQWRRELSRIMGKSEDAPPRDWKWVLNGEDEKATLKKSVSGHCELVRRAHKDTEQQRPQLPAAGTACCLRGGCLTGPNHSGVELRLVKCKVQGRKYSVCGYKGKQVRDNIPFRRCRAASSKRRSRLPGEPRCARVREKIIR